MSPHYENSSRTGFSSGRYGYGGGGGGVGMDMGGGGDSGR